VSIFLILEALSSCAIEGNQWAKHMLSLLKENPDTFWKELYESGLLDDD